MNQRNKRAGFAVRASLCMLALFATFSATGCQGMYSGQVLPSPYYLSDDVQYFAPGPEFVLAREAAAMKKAAEDEESIDVE